MQEPKWNEARLDDLKTTVDEGFKRMDEEFKAVRGETKEGFEKVDEEFKAVRGELKAGFDRMHRSLLGAAVVVIAALLSAPHL